MTDQPATTDPKPKPASDRRQRTRQCVVRLTPEEHARVQERADKSGMRLGALFRAAVLGDAGPRARRHIPINDRLLLRTLGELGRVGNNLNQIARRLNAGERAQLAALSAELSSYRGLRLALYDALGRDPEIADATQPREEARRDHQRRKQSRA